MKPLACRSMLAFTVIVVGLASESRAGDRFFRRRARPIQETVTTVRPENQVAPSPMLGSFQPSLMVNVGANPYITGGYGRENSLSVYGPLSAFRAYAAPVPTVVRGYDGVLTEVEGVSFSYPNFPPLSPVVYPSRATNYSALKFQTTPPRIDRGTNFIDHN